MRTASPLLLLALLACKDADDPSPDSTGVEDSAPVDPTDADGDGVPAEEDCDDANSTVYPGAPEQCDGLDNSCDGVVDEGVGTSWYTDGDGDGYGDTASATVACEPPEGAVALAGDCDDANPAYNPGAAEPDCADPNDYNCDGSVGYADADGDGYAACEECDDTDPAILPGAEEVCDSRDNDCDGQTDEGVTSTWSQDRDGDGYGDPDYSVEACEPPAGYSGQAGDCDDEDAAVHPAAQEVCGGEDEDCDGLVDDADPSLDTTTASWTWADADGDGYGDAGAGVLSCEAPSGAVADDTDCDDSDASVSPGAPEQCGGGDEDCDGSLDEGFDADSDSILDCDEIDYTVVIHATADDYWDAYVDGVLQTSNGGWSTVETITLTLDSGDHVFAAYATDTGAAIAGFIAAVSIDGAVTYLTGGAGDWRMADTVSGSGWTAAAYDDSSWSAPLACASSAVSSYWGSTPSSLTSLGALWVWHQSCTALGDSYYRLNFTLP